jgi:hypothetical protein
MVQYPKFFCNRVIHSCELCLCLQNYRWWVIDKCPIPTKTPKQALNHIILHWKVDLFNTKIFKGCRIDWLMWQLITTIACHYMCRNPNLGLATKARGCKVASQKGSPGVMSHAFGSVRKCEGIGLHTPKGTPTLGVGVPMDSQMFRERLQGSKPN